MEIQHIYVNMIITDFHFEFRNVFPLLAKMFLFPLFPPKIAYKNVNLCNISYICHKIKTVFLFMIILRDERIMFSRNYFSEDSSLMSTSFKYFAI